MTWTAGFRTAVISPYEQIQLSEPRGFADQTVRQVLYLATEHGQGRPHLRPAVARLAADRPLPVPELVRGKDLGLRRRERGMFTAGCTGLR